MSKKYQILEQTETICLEKRGQYKWLDEVIDMIIENARNIFPLFPSDEIFEKSKVDFICEDHHDGFIHEVWITLEDDEEGLCFAMDDQGFSIIDGTSDVFHQWNINDDEQYSQKAKEMYEFIKNNLDGKTII